MLIGTGFTLPSPLGAYAPTADGAGNTSPPASSLFGPATLLTLGQGSTSTGYGNTLGGGANASGGLIQFDLGAVMGLANAGVPQTAVSPAQQEAEQKAIKLAFDYIDEGNYEGARALMNELLAENKTNAAAVHALGYAELSDDNYADAEQLFLKAHMLNPTVGYERDAQNARTLQLDDDEVVHRARAMVAAPAYRDEGIRLLIAVTERNYEHTQAHMLLGDALLDSADPTNGLLQYDAAVRSADVGLLPQLQTRLTELARSLPNSAFVQQLLGRTQLRQEDYVQAILTLTHANQLAGDLPHYRDDLAEAHVGTGREQLARGDINGAMASFERAEELNPEGLLVKQALAEGYVARAELHTSRRDYKSALEDYRNAANLFIEGEDTRALRERAARGAFSTGRALERQRIDAGEEIDAEVSAFQVAHDLDPDNRTYKEKLAEVRNALGDQHIANGDLKQAAYAYRRAHELFKNNDTYKQNTINAFVAYGDDRLANLNYDDAIEAYREAYLIDTDELGTKQKLAGAYNARGLDHKSWERWSDAAADFLEALHLFPDNEEYQANYDSVNFWDD